jgi:hypothetical protein
MESLIEGLYRPLLKVMGVLAFVFLAIPFIVRRPGGGERVRIDPRLVLILVLTGVGFMFIEMAGIYRYQLYLHHPTLALIVVLSSMILGAGLGSLHSGTIPEGRKESRIAPYSAGVVLGSIALFLAVPLWGHPFLCCPCRLFSRWSLSPSRVLASSSAHRPLSLMPIPTSSPTYCLVLGDHSDGLRIRNVIASILARDYGMFLVAGLGILSYLSLQPSTWRAGDYQGDIRRRIRNGDRAYLA